MSGEPDLEGEKDYYDGRWSKKREYQNNLKMARAAAILEAITRTRRNNPRILDLGCGTGWLASILSHFGPTTGVELSPEAVRRAQDRYPSASFVQADFRTWEPEPGGFELVVSQEVIEHLEDQEAYLRLARRALIQGGHLVLTTPNKATFDRMTDDVRKKWSDQPIEKWLTAAQLKRMVGQAGFDVTHQSSIILGHGGGPLHVLAGSRRVRDREALSRLAEWGNYGLHLVLTARAR